MLSNRYFRYGLSMVVIVLLIGMVFQFDFSNFHVTFFEKKQCFTRKAFIFMIFYFEYVQEERAKFVGSHRDGKIS